MVPNDRYFKKIRLKELGEGLDKPTKRFYFEALERNNEIGVHKRFYQFI